MMHIRSKLKVLSEFTKESERRKAEEVAKGELTKLTE